MSTPIDDLHVGQWIAVVGDKVEPEPNMFGYAYRRDVVSGQPLQIIAISLPFLAVTNGHMRFAIDVREFDVKLLHRKYVEMMKGHWIDEEHSREGVAEKPKPEPTKSTEGMCPVCGDRLIRRLGDDRCWHLFCRECGFQGSRGKDESL